MLQDADACHRHVGHRIGHSAGSLDVQSAHHENPRCCHKVPAELHDEPRVWLDRAELIVDPRDPCADWQ